MFGQEGGAKDEDGSDAVLTSGGHVASTPPQRALETSKLMLFKDAQHLLS